MNDFTLKTLVTPEVTINDPLSELLRVGARGLIAQTGYVLSCYFEHHLTPFVASQHDNPSSYLTQKNQAAGLEI